MSNNRQQLACLYTKHKTQKRKVWQDGRLVLKASKAILHDADPPPGSGDPSLGECEISTSQHQAMLQQFTGRLETERYLIEIEGPWTNNNNSSFSSQTSMRQPIGKKGVSSSMQKLLKSKFQRPKSYVPPPPGAQRSRSEQLLGKRRRPLQPGELVAKHYGGDGNNFGGSSRGGFDDSQTHWNHQHEQDSRRENLPQHNRGAMGETNGQGRFRPEIQKHGQDHQHLSNEQPANSIQSSSRVFVEASKDLQPSSGAGIGNTAQFRNDQNQQHRRPVPRRRNNPNAFAQNEFDSAKYYGEEEDNGKEKELRLSSQASSYAQTRSDDIRGEQQRNDNRSDINPYINRSNPNGSSIHTTRNNNHLQETHVQKQPNPYVHENQSQASSVSSITLKTRNTSENSKMSNGIGKDNQSISKAVMEQQSKSDKITSSMANRSQNRKDEEEEESEEEDDDFSDDDMGAPVSFRLKPIEPIADANKNGKSSSMLSGNRLLALFGAGTNKNALNDKNDDGNHKKVEIGSSNQRSDNDKENSTLMGIGGRQDDKEKRKVVNDQKDGTEKQQGNLSGVGGFYLPPADSSSEESSDEE